MPGDRIMSPWWLTGHRSKEGKKGNGSTLHWNRDYREGECCFGGRWQIQFGWLHFLSHGGGTIRTISLENGPMGPSPVKMLEFQIRNFWIISIHRLTSNGDCWGWRCERVGQKHGEYKLVKRGGETSAKSENEWPEAEEPRHNESFLEAKQWLPEDIKGGSVMEGGSLCRKANIGSSLPATFGLRALPRWRTNTEKASLEEIRTSLDFLVYLLINYIHGRKVL